jgi:imidazolonepropionase-like amidohydrolase
MPYPPTRNVPILAAGLFVCFVAAGGGCSRPASKSKEVAGDTHAVSDAAPQHAPAAPPAPAVDEAKQPITLFKNVKVFDGKSSTLSAPTSVLVVGHRIERIGGDIAAPAQATIIDSGGRTLMPGLIDAHWHAMLVRPTPAEALTWDVGYANVVAAVEAKDTLLRGFTTVRDVGGPVFGLKRAIDDGVIPGPRIYPSGAMITITSGHGDFRQPFEVPRQLGSAQTRMEQIGGALIADSPDEVRLRAREQLLLGATQIKLTGGGGVASPHSPLDASTFTEPELRAAVEAAENWGTYVTVHAYTPASIHRALKAGVKCIEHGHLMDDATAAMIAQKGAWLSLQPFPEELGAAFPPGSEQRAKFEEVLAGMDTAYKLARKHNLKTAWGTDVLFSPALARSQGALLVKLSRWYTPAEILVMATSTNAQLLAMAGKRNPYPGKLGVVEEGALADLLLVDGDPLQNIQLVANPAQAFVVIMKNGQVYKNVLQ